MINSVQVSTCPDFSYCMFDLHLRFVRTKSNEHMKESYAYASNVHTMASTLGNLVTKNNMYIVFLVIVLIWRWSMISTFSIGCQMQRGTFSTHCIWNQ